MRPLNPIEPSSPASPRSSEFSRPSSKFAHTMVAMLVVAAAAETVFLEAEFGPHAPVVVEYVFDEGAVIDLDSVDAVQPQDGTGQEVLASFTVSNVSATQISSSGVYPSSWQCNNATATQVFRVNSGDVATTNGIGPYCSTCALGQTFSVPTQTLFLLASGGTPSVQCSRVQTGSYASSGGITKGFADSVYCALAGCTMTGAEAFSGTNPDVSTPGAEDLNLLPGSGVVEIKKVGNPSILRFTDGSGNTANVTWTPNDLTLNNAAGGGAHILFGGDFGGVAGNAAATTVVGGFHDGITVTSIGTALFEVLGEGAFSVKEGTAPTSAAGKTFCYADSTAHVLECSYNADPFDRSTRDTSVLSSSDTAVSSATFTDVAGLQANLVSGATYTCTGWGSLNESTAADGAKVNLSYAGSTTTATSDIEIIGATTSTSLGPTSINGVNASVASMSTASWVVHVNVTTSAAGTLKVQIAQVAHTTGTVTTFKGASLSCLRG